ncbi:hypothetical protein C8R47DRAFT_1073047 [Mycena vitilis]|nr:hypothetical protein C8R47DRAFT_1073047 [Mycena vitilis]
MRGGAPSIHGMPYLHGERIQTVSATIVRKWNELCPRGGCNEGRESGRVKRQSVAEARRMGGPARGGGGKGWREAGSLSILDPSARKSRKASSTGVRAIEARRGIMAHLVQFAHCAAETTGVVCCAMRAKTRDREDGYARETGASICRKVTWPTLRDRRWADDDVRREGRSSCVGTMRAKDTARVLLHSAKVLWRSCKFGFCGGVYVAVSYVFFENPSQFKSLPIVPDRELNGTRLTVQSIEFIIVNESFHSPSAAAIAAIQGVSNLTAADCTFALIHVLRLDAASRHERYAALKF